MKKKFLSLSLLFIVLFSLVSCVSTNEASREYYGWWVEEGVPTYSESVPEGQMYLDSLTYDLYQYSYSEWYLVGNIKGKDGASSNVEIKNGYWFISGVNTGVKAKGEDGTSSVISIKDGYWYINGVNTEVPAGNVENTVVSPTLTKEEFNAQPITRGNGWDNDWSLSTRAKIYIKIEMNKGTKITFSGDSSIYKWSIIETTEKNYPSSGTYKDSDWNTSWTGSITEYTTNVYDSAYIIITIAHVDTSNANLTDEEVNSMHSMFTVEGDKTMYSNSGSNNGSNGTSSFVSTENMKSINHRGWYKAPENTLSAYRESAANGFKYVECDVQFTSDGVAVLLHDDTIDRTSNGSGKILSIKENSKIPTAI